MLVTEDEVRSLLNPHHQGLDADVRDSWSHWESRVRLVEPTFHVRARDSVVYSFVANRLRKRFADAPDVRVRERHEQILLTILDAASVERLVVRVKKLDIGLRYRNYPTRRAQRMRDQQPTFDVARVPIVIVGYQLDEFQTSISATWVVLWHGESRLWEYRLDHAASGTVVQMPLFGTPSLAASVEAKAEAFARRVVPKANPNDTTDPTTKKKDGGSSE